MPPCWPSHDLLATAEAAAGAAFDPTYSASPMVRAAPLRLALVSTHVFALALTPGGRDDSEAISPRYCVPERAQVHPCLTAADITPLFMRCKIVTLSCNLKPQGLRERPLAMNAAALGSPGRHALAESTFARVATDFVVVKMAIAGLLWIQRILCD